MRNIRINIRYCLLLFSLLLFISTMQAQTQVNQLTIPDVTCIPGETISLSVELMNESTVTGGQIEVILPSGLVVNNVTLNTERSNNHTIDFSHDVKTGKLIVLFYASPNTSIVGNSGPLLQFSCIISTGFETGTYPVVFGDGTKLAANSLTSVKMSELKSGTLTVNKILTEYILTSTAEGTFEITPDQTSLHLIGTVMPENATNRDMEWEIREGSHLVNLSESGVLSANGSNLNGKVTIIATTLDGSGAHGVLEIAVRGFTIPVASITVSTAEGITEITPSSTSLNLQAIIQPSNATMQAVEWSLQSGDHLVNLSEDGVVTANGRNRNGEAVVRATALDGSGIFAELSITIKDFITPLEINKVEYFIDKDPGYGQGMQVGYPVDDKLTFTAGLENIKDGFHTIYVRAQDTYGKWGQTVRHPFVKVHVPHSELSVSSVEYFIDKDPGYGKGINAGTPAEGNLSFTAPLSDLKDGFHTVYVRALDSFDAWGHTLAYPFVKTGGPDITHIEYFFDNDPGEGNGVAVPLDSNTPFVDMTFSIDLSYLEDGEHTIHVRAKNEHNMWSLIESAPFVLSATSLNTFEWVMPLHIYPNPADAECFISIDVEDEREYLISIFTMSGNKIVETLEKTTGGVIKVNTGNLINGVYLLSVYDKEKDRKVTKRLMVKH